MTGMGDVLDPTDINIYRDLAGGTTTANILHGSANAIGGKTLVIKLRWGKTRPERHRLRRRAARHQVRARRERHAASAARRATPPERFPTTRQGVDYVMRDAFTRAKAYQKAWARLQRREGARARTCCAPRAICSSTRSSKCSRASASCTRTRYRADEILMLIRVADEIGFKVATFQHVLEGYKVAKEIAAHGAGASTFSDWWGYKIEAEDAIPVQRRHHDASKGVLVSINSDDAEQARRLNNEAAKTVRYGGLTDDEALATVTINPAKQLRIDNRVGSLEVGKDADVVIWNHHPLQHRRRSSTAPTSTASSTTTAMKDLQRVAAIETEKGAARRPPAPAAAAQAPASAPRRRSNRSTVQAQRQAARPGRSPTRASSPSRAR